MAAPIVDDAATAIEAPAAGAPRAEPPRQSGDADAAAEARIREHVEQLVRLQRVHGRLVVAAARARWCDDAERASYVGAYLLDRPEGGRGPVYERLFGVGPRPTVIAVAPGSPAAGAGLRAGDVVESIDGRRLASAREGMARLQALAPAQSAEWVVRRAKTSTVLRIAPVAACRQPAMLMPRADIGAWADGDTVRVTKGLMAFAERDEDLALVVAHELAHLLLHHGRDKQRLVREGEQPVQLLAAALTSGVTDVPLLQGYLARSGSRSFETEADTLALYLMAAADYPLDAAPSFWWRLASVHPVGPGRAVGVDHPSPGMREATMRRIVDAIRDARDAGHALQLPPALAEALRG